MEDEEKKIQEEEEGKEVEEKVKVVAILLYLHLVILLSRLVKMRVRIRARVLPSRLRSVDLKLSMMRRGSKKSLTMVATVGRASCGWALWSTSSPTR